MIKFDIWIGGALFGWLPRGYDLSEASFTRRHRAMRTVLWVKIALLLLLAIVIRPPASALVLLGVAMVGVLGDLGMGRRRIRAAIVVGALLACDEALLATLNDLPQLELTLAVTLVSAALYQSWRPFLLAYGLVAGHHLLLSHCGVLWRLAELGMVTLLALVQLSLWRSIETARMRSREVQAAVLEAEERQLRVRAELADRQRESVQRELADLILRAELSEELEQMVAALGASGENVAGHAEKAQQVMNEFMQAIVNISYAVMDGENTWSVAHDQTMLTEVTIEQLSTASNSIVGLAEEISQIAGKTRMLSFNATIEAARAGEAGLGFGVVAGEVRQLADQVSGATSRITTVVEDIKSGATAAQGAVAQINQVLAQARESQRTISQAVELQTAAAEQARSAISSLHADARTMGSTSTMGSGSSAVAAAGAPGSGAAEPTNQFADIWL